MKAELEGEAVSFDFYPTHCLGRSRRKAHLRFTVGVFASCGIDGYLVHHQQGGALLTPEDPGALFLTETGNEKDYISNRVAFQNDYRGPAVTVTSACSSGLVAVAQGAAAIAAGDCDVAVCGASSLTFPNLGYLYQPGP